VADEKTDEELDGMILRELRDDEAHHVTRLAEVAGESVTRVDDRLASMRREGRVWPSPVAPDRWMRVKANETEEQWTDRIQAYANHHGLYLKTDGPDGEGGGYWLVRITADGSESKERDDWFGPFNTRREVEERIPKISVGDRGTA
jgi:hypothetical protein